MSPTLKGNSKENGDRVLTEKLTYLFRDPERWEIVCFNNNEGLQVMKRVIAKPGETISLNNFKLKIDKKEVEIPKSLENIKYYSFGKLNRRSSYTCRDGFFVMGDNSRDSEDSRFHGEIYSETITGRPLLRIWPLSRIGFINP